MLECKKQREISLVCCIDRVSTRKRKRIREIAFEREARKESDRERGSVRMPIERESERDRKVSI